ncbi:protein transport protein Sec16B-like [Corvus kubaryi]|uniref:protein transport protein Sec16B-like n=1 Tax=Corvus kubaryi TaxID=68294 RepID=UPI001C0556F5|nr:protein transport protein Sec16B-like [Corvus kubaryi]
MEPWAPVQPPQPRERPAAWGPWAEGLHGPPAPLRRQLLRAGQAPRPGSWHGSHLPGYPRDEGHHPRGDTRRPASLAERCDSGYPSQPGPRQGYEDPPWQYPAAGYGDGYPYQSHQWQPVAWQDDRDLRQRESYGKSYRDQHYYRGYHPNLATGPPGQDRTQTYSSCEESYISTARREGTGEGTLSSDSGEAGGQPKEPSGQPSLLLQYHESGLSSSSHELSQYIRDGADHYDPVLPGSWNVGQTGGPSMSTPTPAVPLKFPELHTALCFGPGGHLVLACPQRPAEGRPPRVELHSLEAILHGTEELEELQAFPGPLAREDLHKVDVMTFCQQKITTGCDLSTQRGRDSSLLWKLLVLLCRQNGSMVGSDTAELLMQDCRRQDKYKRQDPAMGLTDDEWASRQPGTLDLITGEVPPVVETQAQIVEKFTKLLYYGRKKEALVWAMRNQLWGHALFLSSKMDPRTYSWVLTGFTSTLATNDPLQTLFQLMSGRIPQAALCCGDATWGDWRPHLAVMLSNKVGDTELNQRAIVTMGDTLASKGAVEAAHFCYLMADIPFGYFGAKADRMALLGSSRRQAFSQFARTEAIQRMEIFEYCQQLRQPESFLLPFQVYKLLYASRLADHGLPAQALQYCEHIGTALLRRDPAAHPVLAWQVVRLAERLKLSDPLLLEMPEQDQELEPDWLDQLRACCREWEVEDALPPEAAPAQLELPCAVLPTADGEPGNEIPQSEDYQYDQWFEPVPLQARSSQEGMSLWSPAPAQVVAPPLPSVGRELQPPVPGQGTRVPPGGDSAEPPPQPVLPAGEAGEPWGARLSPGELQPALPEEQEELPTRIRTVSETSTVSLGDSRPSLDSADEDAAQELAEAVKPEEDKSSGFRWFGWFRSKPTKETSPKAESETDPDSLTSGPQEQTSPPPPHAPLPAGTNPVAQPLARNPGGTQGESTSAVSPVPAEVKGSWEEDRRQSAGQQSFKTGYPGPLPPLASIPLFNPAQVSQVAARPTQPRLLSQHRYPKPL